MTDQLKESLEEHEVNLEVIEQLSAESLRNLYRHFVEEVAEVLEGAE